MSDVQSLTKLSKDRQI